MLQAPIPEHFPKVRIPEHFLKAMLRKPCDPFPRLQTNFILGSRGGGHQEPEEKRGKIETEPPTKPEHEKVEQDEQSNAKTAFPL